MTIGLRFFYRHIHVTGLENIPAKGPAIIIANHASSLMDAALLGILLKRPAFFFARGDVFVNKPVQQILSWLHMMPVHHHAAGRQTIAANNESFSEGRRILTKGGVVVFFPESTSHIERQLLTFRKGIFRLAFKTAVDNAFSFDIPIIAVGITYEDPVACRMEVQVHASNPLLLSGYKKAYEENPAATVLRISKDAHQLMNKEVLHIENKKRLQTAEELLIINRNNDAAATSKWRIRSKNKLEKEQIICKKTDYINETEFENLQQESAAYFNELGKFGLNDQTISIQFTFSTGKKILVWIGFPLYLAGMVVNALPVILARLIADKKVYRKDFYSWIFVACYSLLYFFWAILLLFSIGLYAGWKYSIGLFSFMLLTGVFAYLYTGWLKEVKQQRKLRQLSNERFNALQNKRNAILKRWLADNVFFFYWFIFFLF